MGAGAEQGIGTSYLAEIARRYGLSRDPVIVEFFFFAGGVSTKGRGVLQELRQRYYSFSDG